MAGRRLAATEQNQPGYKGWAGVYLVPQQDIASQSRERAFGSLAAPRGMNSAPLYSAVMIHDRLVVRRLRCPSGFLGTLIG
jgi:hypothetical protein